MTRSRSNKMESSLTSSPPLITFKNLGCTRDERVLFSGIDYDIHAGDIVQVEGPNGTGKTTLLRALTRLFPEYEGDILWQDQAITTVTYEFLSQLLFIGHLPGIKKTLTAYENLQFLANLNGSYDRPEIEAALAEVGLYGYEDTPCYQLSAGQNRRIALARLYVSNALLWVLDEPYTAVDVEGIAKLERLFEQHAANGGCVVMTSHQQPNIQGLKKLSLLDYQSTTHTHISDDSYDMNTVGAQ